MKKKAAHPYYQVVNNTLETLSGEGIQIFMRLFVLRIHVCRVSPYHACPRPTACRVAYSCMPRVTTPRLTACRVAYSCMPRVTAPRMARLSPRIVLLIHVCRTSPHRVSPRIVMPALAYRVGFIGTLFSPQIFE